MSRCPGEAALARAIDGDDDVDPAVTSHLAGCASCRREVDETRRAIELARSLTVSAPDPARREELRTTILLRAADGGTGAATPVRRRWWPVAAALAAAAAIVLVAVAVRGRGTASHAGHGTVHARADARYDLRASGGDEVVTLLDGVIDVEVTPLGPGERFRVITGDGEVEVRGTAFEVTAELGRLVAVRVDHGRVEVRPRTGDERTLLAGEAWTASPALTALALTAPPAASSPASASSSVASPASASSSSSIASSLSPGARSAGAPRATSRVRAFAGDRPRPPVPATTSAVASAAPPADDHDAVAPAAPADLAYDQAWAALRAGDFARAATGFARVTVIAPDGPLAEDAGYWYAVSLARAHRAEATTAFRDFLDRRPTSTHAGEASAMLGWLLVDAGQRDEAALRFRAAAADRSAAVRASAKAGLAALGL